MFVKCVDGCVGFGFMLVLLLLIMQKLWVLIVNLCFYIGFIIEFKFTALDFCHYQFVENVGK